MVVTKPSGSERLQAIIAGVGAAELHQLSCLFGSEEPGLNFDSLAGEDLDSAWAR